MRLKRVYTTPAVLLTVLALAVPVHADRVDDYIRAQMEMRKIPGLSMAILQSGKIVKAVGYGVIDEAGSTSVTPSTLFQAGSISKSVSALGALRLVEEGKLSLDEDVNAKLTTWKLPENDFTRQKKVTLRGILSHTAGLTVHGFPGYATDAAKPTLVQVLDGAKPANTPAIRVDILPGSQWRYSGGGYTVMQQLILDVTGDSFPRFMRTKVLDPLGMSESSFEQPLPPDRAKLTASGYYSDRKAVNGRWHIYPEMAAAGLWTTPSDLLRFAVGIQKALAGSSTPVISQAMARQMITNVKGDDGLGLFLAGSGKALRFSHDGRDEGFDAYLTAYAETGQGAAIMINANDNSRLAQRLLDFIAREYKWPGYPLPHPEPVITGKIRLPRYPLEPFEGRYEVANNQMLTLQARAGALYSLADDLPDEAFRLTKKDTAVSTERHLWIILRGDWKMPPSGMEWIDDRGSRWVTKIGPLVHQLKKREDPRPARSREIEEVLRAMEQGKASRLASRLTPGAVADLGNVALPELAAMKSIAYLAEEEISPRVITRHGGKVARIVYFRMNTLLQTGQPRYLLVYLTDRGLVTDLDAVTD